MYLYMSRLLRAHFSLFHLQNWRSTFATVSVVCILRCQNGGMKDAVSRAVTGLSELAGEVNCMR